MLVADERTNALIIMASRGDLATIEEIVTDMDMMLSQVMVEAVILEVNLDDSVDQAELRARIADRDFAKLRYTRLSSLVNERSASRSEFDEAKAALQESPVFALRNLSVEQVGDNLILSGTVSTFYHKQLAQEVIRSVAHGL